MFVATVGRHFRYLRSKSRMLIEPNCRSFVVKAGMRCKAVAVRSEAAGERLSQVIRTHWLIPGKIAAGHWRRITNWWLSMLAPLIASGKVFLKHSKPKRPEC
jgi:hypothetical protein